MRIIPRISILFVVICVAAVGGILIQTADAYPDILQSTTYDADKGTVTFHFPGVGIDPSSLDGATVQVYGAITRAVYAPSTSLSLVEAGEHYATYQLEPNDLYGRYSSDDLFARIDNVTNWFNQQYTGWKRLNVLGDAPPIISAKYIVDTGRLILNHVSNFDPFSVDPTRISIRDNSTTITLAADQHIWPVDIYGSVTAFQLTTAQGFALISMEDPTVQVDDTMIDYRGSVGVEPYTQTFPLPINIFTSLERAEYLTYTNELTIHFTEEVKSSGRGHISVFYEEYRNIVLDVETAELSNDGMSMTFELPPYERYILSLMIENLFMPLPFEPGQANAGAFHLQPQKPLSPAVQLEPGVVFRISDGFRNGMEWVSLDIRGDPYTLFDPSVPDGVIAGRAENHQGNGEIFLYFREPIDPASIDPSRITVERDACSRYTPLETDPVRVDDDGRWAAFWVDASQVGRLSSHNIWVNIDRGAFRTQADGAENDQGYIRLLFNRNAWAYSEDNPWLFREPMAGGTCHITYRIDMAALDNPRYEVPSGGLRFWEYVTPADVLASLGYSQGFIDDHTRMMASAVRDGLDEWSELNPGITFEEVADNDPDIVITWIEGSLLAGGFACLGCVYDNAYISLSFVDAVEIDGVRELYDYQYIKRVTMHEFGHVLGLLHHMDRGHLMYGEDDFLESPYNEHGYIIPARHGH